jgi:hypothetical protein
LLSATKTSTVPSKETLVRGEIFPKSFERRKEWKIVRRFAVDGHDLGQVVRGG